MVLDKHDKQAIRSIIFFVVMLALVGYGAWYNNTYHPYFGDIKVTYSFKPEPDVVVEYPDRTIYGWKYTDEMGYPKMFMLEKEDEAYVCENSHLQ